MTSDSAMLTAIGGWRGASHEVSASTTHGSTTLTMKARAISLTCSARRAANRSKANAAIPIATASFAVPGMCPADSEA